MGWSLGYDSNWNRDVGYGVPATCDHPECNERIDRGLAHVCGGEPYGGDQGCGLYFCANHLFVLQRCSQLCERCEQRRRPFLAKPDHPDWLDWKLTHESWKEWRDANPEEVEMLRAFAKPIAGVETVGPKGDER